MRGLLVMALLLGWAMDLHAATYIYVSKAPEETIQVFRLDPADGSLKSLHAVAVKGTPGMLSPDPAKKYLFASLRSTSTLASFRVDPTTGNLTLLSTAALPKDENAAFAGTDRTGRWLLSASYAAGKIVVHGINVDGTIKTSAIQTITTTKTAHAAVPSPENKFVFVPHVTPNAVYQYKFNPATGQLTDAGKAPGGTPKAGPRHLAFHPSGKLAFTSDEEGNSVTAYRYDPAKGLIPLQTLPTLPDDFKGKNTTAEVKVHPSGKFVWVSNRGHDSLAGFALNGDKLTALGTTPTEKTPRSFDLTPDGRYLLAAGEGSGKLAVYRVEDTGRLTPLHTLAVGKSLTWVRVVQLGE